MHSSLIEVSLYYWQCVDQLISCNYLLWEAATRGPRHWNGIKWWTTRMADVVWETAVFPFLPGCIRGRQIVYQLVSSHPYLLHTLSVFLISICIFSWHRDEILWYSSNSCSVQFNFGCWFVVQRDKPFPFYRLAGAGPASVKSASYWYL